MRLVRVLVVSTLLAVGVVGLTGVDPAQACSCAAMSDAERERQASIIFIGTVRSENHHANTDGYVVGPGEYEYLVDVEQTVKGTVEDPATVWTSDQSSACGTRLTVGDRYRLHPHRAADGRLTIGLCSGDQHLGKGAVAPPVPTTTTSRAPPSMTVSPSTASAPTTVQSTTTTSTSADGEAAAPPPTIRLNDERRDGASGAGPLVVGTAAVLSAAGLAAAVAVWFRRRRSSVL